MLAVLSVSGIPGFGVGVGVDVGVSGQMGNGDDCCGMDAFRRRYFARWSAQRLLKWPE